MSTLRNHLIDLIEQGVVPPDMVAAALATLQIPPEGRRWRTFLDRLLLWLGFLALAFALMFFIAYNWQDLGRFSKFALVEVGITLAIAGYLKCQIDQVAGKVALLVATLCLGVLLALYGQTYQTGADTWELFFTWALLMLPWAAIGRFPALWILWIALINIAIILYYKTFGGMFGVICYSEPAMFWIVFLCNTLAFIAWQLLAQFWRWLAESWAIRLLAFGSGVPLTWLVFFSIFGYPNFGYAPGLTWGVWLGSMLYVYTKVRLDLFILAGCCLSAITVTVAFVGYHLLPSGDAGGFLVLALMVIAMGSGAAFWLKKLHKESLT